VAVLVSASAAVCATPAARAQELTGWAASYESGGLPAVETHASSAAFYLKSGETAHPSVAPAGLVAKFDGVVTISAGGKYRFGADCEGGRAVMRVFGPGVARDVVLEIDGSRPASRVSDWVQLPAGTVNVQYIFTRAGDAPAKLRALWEMEYATSGGQDVGFRREPIPDRFVKPIPSKLASCVQGRLEMRGRVLLGELGCTSCHAGESEAAVLIRTAPDLSKVGSRANPNWMRKWLNDPQGMKAHSGMPAVLGTDARAADATAENIAHYLMTLVGEDGPWKAESPAMGESVVKRGEELYHSVGCVACHGGYTEEAKRYAAPHPHGMLAAKWRPSSLSAFLREPHTSRPGGRMPSMNLTEQEADAVSVYLLKTWGGLDATATFTPDAAKVALGREAFVTTGCLNCHAVEDAVKQAPASAKRLVAAPLARVRAYRGCMDPRDTKSPRYTLSAEDRSAITAALKGAPTWGKAAAPADMAVRSLDALSCTACHEYASQGGVAETIKPLFGQLVEADLGDEGRIPPRLTEVGSKLTTQWLRQVLLEKGAARPYMKTRMPQFGEQSVGELAEALAATDGVAPNTDVREPTATDELALAGKKLVGEGGLYCINCHTVNGKVTGTPGPDITGFASRIRYEWWADYIHDPDRFKPGTRMQKFYRFNKGNVTTVLEGDSRKQSDAMWVYFNLGEFMPLPDGLMAEGGMMVNVKDRPVILRTFMQDGGSRAVAVGYPLGIHFAFDAVNVRLVDAWRGAFLDASGAWANRGGTNAGGQGPTIWKAPAGPALVLGAKPEKWPSKGGAEAGVAFRGYRVNADGSPTFRYSLRPAGGGTAVEVEEQFRPTTGERPAIARSFKVSGMASGQVLWLNVGDATNVQPIDGSGCSAVLEGKLLRVTAEGDGAVTFGLEITP
jgi:mono/diheme cytochrome c family protein